MRINVYKLLFSLMLVFSSWFAGNAIAGYCPSSQPIPLLQCIADNMIAGLKNNKATLRSKPQIVYQLANTFVVPYADLNLMSQHVLSAQTWNRATASQKARFKEAFKRTLIRTYASALTSYQDQVVKFYPPRGRAGNSIQVNSVISGSGSSINVSYILMRAGSGWKLYDMSVEGVSMLDSFRSQFSDILAQGDMEQLLQRLNAHNTGRNR